MDCIRDEGIARPERFEDIKGLNKDYCLKAIEYILGKIDANIRTFTDVFPAAASVGNVYPAVENTDWTAGFWTGMLWLAYEVSGCAKYRETAEIQLRSYKKRIEERIYVNTHDLGFLYTLSCIAAYKLTENEGAKAAALKAADTLMERYFDKAGIIQAWGDLDNPDQRGRMIIDCCMNLPLLYWASEKTGEARYRNAALSHALQTARYIVREDASSYHTFYMDVETGEPRYGKTNQGYSDDSCWSRGQAWGIYGLALSYRHTGCAEFIDVAKKLANYYLNRLPEDSVCYWDLTFTEGSEEHDSSAAAIAVCGLLEIAGYLPLTDPYKKIYENAAMKIVGSLSEKYTSVNCPKSNGILLHAVYSKPAGRGVDECNIWGDYFYFESLMRMIKDWKPYW